MVLKMLFRSEIYLLNFQLFHSQIERAIIFIFLVAGARVVSPSKVRWNKSFVLFPESQMNFDTYKSVLDINLSSNI